MVRVHHRPPPLGYEKAPLVIYDARNGLSSSKMTSPRIYILNGVTNALRR